MTDILIATLGEAAPAVSFAYELWRDKHPDGEFAIVHTDPEQSRIHDALGRLQAFLPQHYAGLRVRWHEIQRQVNGQLHPLIDLDGDNAWDYFRGIFEILHEYREAGYGLHLLISGGRKEMAIYASTAAAALFHKTGDHLWTVHSPKDLIESGTLTIPAGRKQDVHLVRLPILPASLNEEELQQLSSDPQAFFDRRGSTTRQRFLDLLSPAERELVRLLEENPYLEVQDIAQRLRKQPKTIENQISALYTKMSPFVSTDSSQKRLQLMDLLRGLFD